tara:strand:+ start:238 stop:858 length:621 start_codon:yes stop_codon:yes gene_type:complete
MINVKSNFNLYANKILIISVIFQSILLTFSNANILRRRSRNLNMIDNIKCLPNTNGSNCICPGKCLTYDNYTNFCQPLDCWKWNDMKSECIEDGKSFVSAIVLQSIPITGIFGSGFGNMGRWDIFGAYMGLFFGGCFLICCITLLCGSNQKNNDSDDKFGTSCCGCILILALISLYIWGIVVIINKEYKAPWKNWKGESIMCPLVS